MRKYLVTPLDGVGSYNSCSPHVIDLAADVQAVHCYLIEFTVIDALVS